MAAGIALSHNVFDSTVYLGVCDKIVPGLVIAAATFGHLPAVFLPAGPMTSGIPNDEKSKVRQQFATGEVGRDKLMEAEMASYHGPGTCTFYGTANTNQMLMEFMGLHLPGASFVNPGTPLARGADGRGREAGAGDLGARQRVHAGLRRAGRAGVRQRDRRAERDGRVDEPADPPDRDGAGGGGPARLGGLRRALGRDAADGAGLSERARRREPFPCRGRPRLHDRRAARGGAAASRHPHGRGRGAGALHPGAEADRRRAGLGRGGARDAQRQDRAPGRATPSQPTGGRAAAEGQPRDRGDEGLGGGAGAACRRGAGAGLPRPGRGQARPSAPASSPRTPWWWCASRGRRRTACRSCTA